MLRRRIRRAAAAAGLLACLPGSATAARPADLAASTARYTVRFDATWTSTSHPLDYPASAHWSPLVGGTHDGSVQFWQAGQLASVGIKDMAERGLTAPLASEVQAQIAAGHAGAVVLGGGIATGAGMATATFDITQQFPLATVVTMIAPSPDWFVGVAGVPLFTGGQWVEVAHVPLFAYDAGTDSGTNYSSPNQATVPPQPIALNPAAPFANGNALGSFTFTRIDPPITVTVPALGASGALGLAVVLAALAIAMPWWRRRAASR
jgi:hypothetical protein